MNLLDELRAIVGDAGVLDADAVAQRAAGSMRGDRLRARALVRPRDTAEVAAVLRCCHARGVAVVTHGGLSGLVGGADAAPDELILSLERMNAIESIDPVQRTATVQAGVVLQTLQEAVDAQGLSFPLDLGARGSATLGGNAATNAGGNRVIRYGMTRDQVLGLEAVLADGTVVPALNRLVKNNAGYDLKQLFIGSEGTLGVITRLVLRLREQPRSQDVALVAVRGFDDIPRLLGHMDRSLGGALSAFEVMWQSFYRLVTTPPARGQPPLSQQHPLYVLLESQGAEVERDAERFQAALEAAFGAELIVDAAIAKSVAERRALWALRDDTAQLYTGGTPIGFDVSLPLAAMPAYLAQLQRALDDAVASHRLFTFGHLGDGNLHLAVQVPAEQHEAAKPVVEALVYRPLAAIGGSVSAEHGIGLAKKAWLGLSRSATELELMRTLKRALDPKGILNPGKVL